MQQFTITLSKVKETKGAVQYKEDAMPGRERVGIFYVRKTAFGVGSVSPHDGEPYKIPMTISMTVEAK